MTIKFGLGIIFMLTKYLQRLSVYKSSSHDQNQRIAEKCVIFYEEKNSKNSTVEQKA